MIAAPADIMASPKGTLIIHYGDTAVQYSLEGIEADLENSSDGTSRIDLWAHVAGENFVDLSNRREQELTLLLELWGEQRRLGASDEALATTRDRIERHIKEKDA